MELLPEAYVDYMFCHLGIQHSCKWYQKIKLGQK